MSRLPGAVTHRPLLLLALAFAGGILLQSYFQLTTLFFIALGAVGLIGIAASRRPELFFAGLALIGLSAGGVRSAWYAVVPANDISSFAASPIDRGPFVTVSGSVAGEPESAHGRQTFILAANQVVSYERTSAVTGLVYLSTPLDDSHPIEYGDRLQVTGYLTRPRGATNPGAFDWAQYLSRRGIGCTMTARWPAAVHDQSGSARGLLGVAEAVRRRVCDRAAQCLDASTAAVLSGILVGTRGSIPDDLRDDFVKTGTVHILATAGVHVGIVVACILGLCRLVGVPRRLGAGLTMAALVLFMLAAGGRPAVVRAAVVAIVWLGGKVLEREPDLLTSLGFAAAVLLLYQPTSILDPGFQLSFVTVGVLIAAMPPWQRLMESRLPIGQLKGMKRLIVIGALDLIGVSIFAQLGSAPIVAAYYNEVPLLGSPANLLVVPLLALIIPAGFLGAATPGFISNIFFQIAGFFVGWVEGIVRFFAGLPLGFVAVVSPSQSGILAYYAALSALIIGLYKSSSPLKPIPSVTLRNAPAAVRAGDD